MDKDKNKIKKKKTRKKNIEFVIVEEHSPKNTTIKASSVRCKNGTKKYKPLGLGCYSQEEIDNYKINQKNDKQKKSTIRKND